MFEDYDYLWQNLQENQEQIDKLDTLYTRVSSDDRFDIAQIKRHVDDLLHYKYLRAVYDDPMWINAAYAVMFMHYLYWRNQNRDMSLDNFFDNFDYRNVKSSLAFTEMLSADLSAVSKLDTSSNQYLQEARNQANSFASMCDSVKTRRTVMMEIFNWLNMNLFTSPTKQ